MNNCYVVDIDREKVVNYGSSSYLGNDGTMVGCYGGQSGYSRTPEVPRVTKHQLSIDPTTQTMHVNLTVTKP